MYIMYNSIPSANLYNVNIMYNNISTHVRHELSSSTGYIKVVQNIIFIVVHPVSFITCVHTYSLLHIFKNFTLSAI